jgi:hypothetical protein
MNEQLIVIRYILNSIVTFKKFSKLIISLIWYIINSIVSFKKFTRLISSDFIYMKNEAELIVTK